VGGGGRPAGRGTPVGLSAAALLAHFCPLCWRQRHAPGAHAWSGKQDGCQLARRPAHRSPWQANPIPTAFPKRPVSQTPPKPPTAAAAPPTSSARARFSSICPASSSRAAWASASDACSPSMRAAKASRLSCSSASWSPMRCSSSVARAMSAAAASARSLRSSYSLRALGVGRGFGGCEGSHQRRLSAAFAG
jgi:hypothetical protein